MTTYDGIPVWLQALDPLSKVGLLCTLGQSAEVSLISDDELDALQRTANGGLRVVALISVDSLDAAAVRVLRTAAQRGCGRIVLIGNAIDDDAVLTAVELGVSGVLRRTEATGERIVHLLRAAAAGDGRLPPLLLNRLLGAPSPGAGGSPDSTLSDRETQVLRLVADGKDTQDIARELCYSERTVKNVLHNVTSRLHLNNRSHAVAYALRRGLI